MFGLNVGCDGRRGAGVDDPTFCRFRRKTDGERKFGSMCFIVLALVVLILVVRLGLSSLLKVSCLAAVVVGM